MEQRHLAYGMATDPLYADVPFFLVLRPGGATHGIFLDNTFRSSFDVGHESAGLLAFGADGGELNYYFIQGPHPKQVIERYTALTGRMPLPPLWALGYHQCRYSYFPWACSLCRTSSIDSRGSSSLSRAT